MRLATDLLVHLARQPGREEFVSALGRALGVEADDAAFRTVVEQLRRRGVLARTRGRSATLRLLASPGRLSLAVVADIVGERLQREAVSSELAREGPGQGGPYERVWQAILAGLATTDVFALAGVSLK
jgi:DNA-binding IscR family transcriptional regulator